MANTTNYNWETPDDTDLVKDGETLKVDNNIDTAALTLQLAEALRKKDADA